MYPFFLCFILSFIISCNSPSGESQVNDYPPQLLTETDLYQVNYKEKDSIPFIHSSGFEFFLTVDSIITEKSTQMRTSIALPNEEVEVQYTYLSSAYPYLEIEIRLVPSISEIHISRIRINSDNSCYYFNSNSNSWNSGSLHDTVTVALGTKTYSNVYSYPQPENYDESTATVQIMSLLYSPEDGILQIGKSNGETFSINK